MIGDSLFTMGAVALAWFVFGIFTGGSFQREKVEKTKPVPLTPANEGVY